MDIHDELALFDLHGDCKRCTKCRRLKPLNEYWRSKTSRCGLKQTCNDCSKKSVRDWRANNLERDRKRNNEYRKTHPEYAERRRKREREKYWADPLKARHDRLRYNYGPDITLEWYRQVEAAQGGVCAICRRKCKTGRSLAVDHNHETGQIRGLLCQKCNHAIGLFSEDTDLMMAAIDYLLSYRNVLREAM